MNLKYNIRHLRKWWMKLIIVGLIIVILFIGYKLFYSYKESIENIETSVENSPAYFSDENYSHYSSGFWSPELIDKVVRFQRSQNRNIQFDMNIIQQQASPEEAETLLKTGKWPWPSEIKDMYKQAITKNNVINLSSTTSLEKAQSIYNASAIKRLLSWNSKEGNLLLYGQKIGHTKGLPNNINNFVRCGTDMMGNSSMKKYTYTGRDGINGSLTSRVDPVSNEEIPGLVNGFQFLEGECNPCVALNDPPDYSCPFLFNNGSGSGSVTGRKPSSIWSYLWGIGGEDASGNSISEIDSINKEIGIEIKGTKKYAKLEDGNDIPGVQIPDLTPKKYKIPNDFGYNKNSDIGA
jgi:hypothetical protein